MDTFIRDVGGELVLKAMIFPIITAKPLSVREPVAQERQAHDETYHYQENVPTGLDDKVVRFRSQYAGSKPWQ